MAFDKYERRNKIKKRVRKVVNGTPEAPRLSVFRSNRSIYAQLIDDTNGVTLASASSEEKGYTLGKVNKIEQAKEVGKLIASKALEKGISSVAFDRNGYLYHGRVKSLAEGAREGGLNF